MGTQPLSDPSHPDHAAWHAEHVLNAGDHPEVVQVAPEPSPAPAAPPVSDPSHPDHLLWQKAYVGGVDVTTGADPAVTAEAQAVADANHAPKRTAKKAPVKKAAAKKAAARKAAAKKAR